MRPLYKASIKTYSSTRLGFLNPFQALTSLEDARQDSLSASPRKEQSRASTILYQLSIPGIAQAASRGGLGGGVASGSGARRAAWMAVFFAGLFLTLVQVQEVITDYLSYPVNTKVGDILVSLIGITSVSLDIILSVFT